MKSMLEKCRYILIGMIKHAPELESIFRKGKSSYPVKEINELLKIDVSFRFLYASSHGLEDIFDETANEKTQSLIDVGLFILTSPAFSPYLKDKLIKVTNITGFLFDRHSYNYFVHQDKLRVFIDELKQISDKLGGEKRGEFSNPTNLYKILDEHCLDIKNRISRNSNLAQVSETKTNEYLANLERIRQSIISRHSEQQFHDLTENSPCYYQDLDNALHGENYFSEIEVKIPDYRPMSEIIYWSIYLLNEKHLGGRVALADTNLEFEKLLSNEIIKFRSPALVNFEVIKEEENLFALVENGIVEIISIKTKG